MSVPTGDERGATLWTLHHHAGVARCGLTGSSRGCRVELTIDRGALQFEHCATRDQAVAIAESWKARLVALGWRDVSTTLQARPKHDRRRS
jgi:hypothetical protein